MKRYRDELFTLKSNMLPVKRGDLRWPQSHQVTHTPQKNFVCCIPNAVSQTKWSVDPTGMKQATQVNDKELMNKWNMHFTASKQCHNRMCTTFNNEMTMIIMKIMWNNGK